MKCRHYCPDHRALCCGQMVIDKAYVKVQKTFTNNARDIWDTIVSNIQLAQGFILHRVSFSMV